MIKWKQLIISILISLGIGGLSGFITKDSMETFENLNKPMLSPPSIVFPIVWGILFLLMGISAYLIYVNKSEYRKPALIIYGIQLVINFFWSIIFFNAQQYLFAFIWLIILLIAIIIMIVLFYKVKPAAAFLQIPYILWVSFAGYLNLMIYLLNR